MSKKEIITELFKICKKRNNFVFNNDLVKEVLREFNSKTNPYDMTKFDDTSKLPSILLEEDYFVAHIGDGKHKFVKGINKIYHKFEDINEKDVINWNYRPSILNDFAISEASILSLCNNHRILHDFLYQDIIASPKMYNSERKRGLTFDYKIGKTKAKTEKLQIEIDLTSELNGYVTVFEGKNTKNDKSWLNDFNTYQLYNPFRFYYNLKKQEKLSIDKITACYLVRQKNKDGSIIRLYNYTFIDHLDITSIKLLKKKQYILNKRSFENEK